MTDNTLTPEQFFAARQILRWRRMGLAALLSVNSDAIRAFEVEGRGLNDAELQKARDILESAGVEFIAENGEGPGVRLRKAPT